MHPLASAVEMFEDVPERLVWLPPVTVGYIYTLSGNPLHFVLAVFGIGGARFYADLIDSDVVVETAEGIGFREGIVPLMRDSYPRRKSWLLRIVVVGYAVSALLGIYDLVVYFDHSNLILVVLAAVWAGLGLIVLLNL